MSVVVRPTPANSEGEGLAVMGRMACRVLICSHLKVESGSVCQKIYLEKCSFRYTF